MHYAVHFPKLANYSKKTTTSFNFGNEIGVFARTLFPNGVLIDSTFWGDKIKNTLKLLKTNKTIFEATFSHDFISVQVDILEKASADTFNIIEVKSGFSLKDEYIEDVTIQYIVLKKTGISINKVFIWILNKNAVDKNFLFIKKDVTDLVELKRKELEDKIHHMRLLVQEENSSPNVKIGGHCLFPYECPFKNDCWKNVKGETIFDMPFFEKRIDALNDGVLNLSDPKLENYNVNMNIVNSIRNKKMWIDHTNLAKDLSLMEYPIASIDFETFQVSIPSFKDTYPLQQIPFQISIHVLDKEMNISHNDYLHQSNSDPRKNILEFLENNIPESGTIVAYYSKFEAQVLTDLIQIYPEKELFLKSLIARLKDPLDIIKNNLYHPNFEGSYSLKKVVPVLLGEDRRYEILSIKDGLEAQEAYQKLISIDSILEKININKNLREYCSADTLNLILIIKYLMSLKHSSI